MANLNIIIGTHGRFGEEIIKSAEMIVGKMENVRAVSLLPEMSFEESIRGFSARRSFALYFGSFTSFFSAGLAFL